MAEFIQMVLTNLNYWVVLIAMTVESSFIPFPSEVVVPPAAWLAANNRGMNIFLLVIVATIGADLGALINYYLARWLGKPFVYKFANSKFGHLCLINQEKIEQAEEYFRKHGATSTFVGRLVPGIRQLISIPAGLAKMKVGPFLLYTTLGAGIWNIVLAVIGYAIAKIYPKINTPEGVADKAKEYSHVIGYCILAIVALGIVWLIYKKCFKKSATKA